MSQDMVKNQGKADFSKGKSVGRIISIVGSKAILLLHNNSSQTDDVVSTRVDIGSLLAIETTESLVLALVSGVSVPMPDDKNMGEEICIAEMELMGELPKQGPNSHGEFKRGVSVYPAIGDFAFKAGGEVLLKAYNFQDQSAVRIGTLLFDKNIPAFIQPDGLLGNHFAVLGATGTGKSCSVALLLRALLKKNPNAHIILLDPHSEYSRSFGSSAEVVTPRDLNMPFWLLNFDEIVEVLVGQNSKDALEAEILGELIPLAKRRFFQNRGRETKVNLKLDEKNAAGFSVDTPVPYRMSDLLSLLEENIGKLDQRKDISPFKRLKAKIESISQDPRYSFMFGSLTVNDTMTDILGRLFRVPVNGKPICIFELTGFPSEVVTVVVSVLCRMTFDFGVWSDGNVPITLVCEEAHRYVPSDKTLGFEPVKRSISRIAKEGRKYGVSLGVVTQRPAEIDPTILAQCNTLFSLRMANDRDQEIVKAAISDSGASLLDILPSLGNGEAIVFGEGVALPARIKLDPLPPQALPKGQTADFTNQWGRDVHDHGFLDEVVTRWREQDIHKPLAVKYSEDLNDDGAAQSAALPVDAVSDANAQSAYQEPATPKPPAPSQEQPPAISQPTGQIDASGQPQANNAEEIQASAPQIQEKELPPTGQKAMPSPQVQQPTPVQQPAMKPVVPQAKPHAERPPEQITPADQIPAQQTPPAMDHTLLTGAPKMKPQAQAAQQIKPVPRPPVENSAPSQSQGQRLHLKPSQPMEQKLAQDLPPATSAAMPAEGGIQEPSQQSVTPQTLSPKDRQAVSGSPGPLQAPQQSRQPQAAPPSPQPGQVQQPASSQGSAPAPGQVDEKIEPPALKSGMEEQVEDPPRNGAPIPGYQRLG